jgi:hypothetical protein
VRNDNFELALRMFEPDAVTIDAERPVEDVYFQLSQAVGTRLGMFARHWK